MKIRTCPYCAGFVGCPKFKETVEALKKVFPETKKEQIYVAATCCAEACPEYFNIKW